MIDYNNPANFNDLKINEQRILLKWIKLVIEPNKQGNYNENLTSYGLKHRFERNAFYITNGTFKGAMVKSGYKPLSKVQTNWIFQIKDFSYDEIENFDSMKCSQCGLEYYSYQYSICNTSISKHKEFFFLLLQELDKPPNLYYHKCHHKYLYLTKEDRFHIDLFNRTGIFAGHCAKCGARIRIENDRFQKIDSTLIDNLYFGRSKIYNLSHLLVFENLDYPSLLKEYEEIMT